VSDFDIVVVGELNADLILHEPQGFPEMGKEKLAKGMLLTMGSASAWTCSNIKAIIASTMENEPKHWRKYYSDDFYQRQHEFFYSMSDRVRYYWSISTIQDALRLMITNLSSTEIPLSLLRQYLSNEYQQIREGQLENRPLDLIRSKIRQVLQSYARACRIHNIIEGDSK